MANEQPASQYATVRRSDRAVNDDEWIRAFLHQAPFGSLATVHETQPFINSNLFVYDVAANAIYTHTARRGRTRSNIEAHQSVCFSVSEIGRLLPADEALEFSVEYAGVSVFGSAWVVTDSKEAEHALQLLLDKYAPHLRPGTHYRPITPAELARTTVYRIDIEQWSGKRKKEVANFPGAFFYGDQDVIRLREYRRDEFLVSTDPEKQDLDLIHGFLSKESYWSRGVAREAVARSMKHSLCFGLFDASSSFEKQVGFARVITDFTHSAHLADTFVTDQYRGRGLGSWLVQCVLEHPELHGVGRWSLHTTDAHEFYGRFGFGTDPAPEHYQVLKTADPD